MNLTRKHSSSREEIQRKVFKYGRRTKIAKKQKSCYLFGVLCRAHESESKTSLNRKIQPGKVDLIAKHSSNTEIQQK